ncbi:hypothetical protein Bhyg_13460 [Pseudolycoriella hygida]|uniref:Uncharacterized protein n=1 Tax=Pseudolycoriella hygida TaxID=35572 RepID=A0A9Q0MQ65_9DIPT|nr:hypothetical protein Bhyg_13460 [Pseudolycoriella hygida]
MTPSPGFGNTQLQKILAVIYFGGSHLNDTLRKTYSFRMPIIKHFTQIQQKRLPPDFLIRKICKKNSQKITPKITFQFYLYQQSATFDMKLENAPVIRYVIMRFKNHKQKRRSLVYLYHQTVDANVQKNGMSAVNTFFYSLNFLCPAL